MTLIDRTATPVYQIIAFDDFSLVEFQDLSFNYYSLTVRIIKLFCISYGVKMPERSAGNKNSYWRIMSVEATNQDIITLLLTSEFMELDCTIHLSILSFRPTVSFPEPECRKAFIAIFFRARKC